MNITRFIAAATTVATLSGAALPALAHESDVEHRHTRPSIKERILDKTAQIRDRITDKREDIQEKREEHRDRLSDNLQDRLKSFWKRAATRMEHIIGRLANVADKIEERLARLHESGVDVGEAREALGEARQELDEARAALRTANAEVDDILANHEPREAFQKLRELHKRVRTQIREAHHSLIEVIKIVRGLNDEA